jgi:hypothetical protein
METRVCARAIELESASVWALMLLAYTGRGNCWLANWSWAIDMDQ